jgi:hypothetical protein
MIEGSEQWHCSIKYNSLMVDLFRTLGMFKKAMLYEYILVNEFGLNIPI